MSQTQVQRNHPYEHYTGTKEWSVIDLALLDLADNKDLEEKTAHEYIVGYLCKALAEKAKGEAMAAESMDDSDLNERERRKVSLSKARDAIRAANPEGRDLVKELLEERRQEAARD